MVICSIILSITLYHLSMIKSSNHNQNVNNFKPNKTIIKLTFLSQGQMT